MKETKKNWFLRHKILSALIGLVLLVVAVNAGSGSKPKTDTAKDTPATAANSEQSKQQDFAFDDGKHEVGKDIKAGTYRTKGGDGSSFGCYWSRLNSFSGELEAIIANNGSYNNGSQVVTIAETDKGFETRGCGKWYAELTQITSSKTTFGDGMVIVGTDIDPGTYKNSGVKDEYSCYWARLKDFSGTLGGIISNEIGSNTIVTIDPSDTGFSSTGCGTWVKQ